MPGAPPAGRNGAKRRPRNEVAASLQKRKEEEEDEDDDVNFGSDVDDDLSDKDDSELLRKVKQHDDSDDDEDDAGAGAGGGTGGKGWDGEEVEEEFEDGSGSDDSGDEDSDTASIRPEIVPGDSSDEEGIAERNTIGNVPLWWYKGEDHIGYDVTGKKIIKQKRKDKLEEHIARSEDPEFWRTVYDEKNDEELRLTDKELRILRRMQSGKFEPSIDPYEPYIDWYQPEEPGLPINVTTIPPKRRFIPSKGEAKMVLKFVRALRNGQFHKKKVPKAKYYDLWGDETGVVRKSSVPFRRPKLPGHAESYRPPPEFLFNDKERQEWREQHYRERKTDFVPRRYDNLRSVPAFRGLMKRRFTRCLDLFLCPRKVQSHKKKWVPPETLLPNLPKPQELRPYPSTLSIQYLGHTEKVNSISVHASGQWLVSGSDDSTVRVWDVSTGRCYRMWHVDGPVSCVLFSPNPAVLLIAAAVNNLVHYFDPKFGEDGTNSEALADFFTNARAHAATIAASAHCKWVEPEAEAVEKGWLATMQLKHKILKIAFHGKGDYIVTLAPEGNTTAVLIHQLSKRSTQAPFRKSKADAKCVAFHPSKPFLFVADSRSVSVYNLLKQKLVHRMRGGFNQLCALDIHPQGDNVIIGSHDKRLSWFDMDLSSLPYRTIRYTKFGVSSVSYHPRLPLFMGGGMDGHLFVFHGRVYDDLLQNALIVPLRKIRAHKYTADHDGVLDCCFHPTQPWAFSAGGDKAIRLWTEI